MSGAWLVVIGVALAWNVLRLALFPERFSAAEIPWLIVYAGFFAVHLLGAASWAQAMFSILVLVGGVYLMVDLVWILRRRLLERRSAS